MYFLKAEFQHFPGAKYWIFTEPISPVQDNYLMSQCALYAEAFDIATLKIAMANMERFYPTVKLTGLECSNSILTDAMKRLLNITEK